MDTLTLRQDTVDRQRREHPVLDGVLLQDIVVVDIVPESVLPVTFDDDAKHIQDGVTVPVKRTAGERNTFRHLRAQPSLVDFLQCQTAGPVDGVHEPNVFLEKGVGFHIISLPGKYLLRFEELKRRG